MKNISKTFLFLLLTFQGLTLAEQGLKPESIISTELEEVQKEITPKDLTQQLKDEYESYYKLCRDTYSEAVFNNQIKFLLINEQSKVNTPILYNMIQETADKLEITIPQILIFKGKLANAFAQQFSSSSFGQMIIGEDLINDSEFGLSYDELKAVVTHELAHLKHQHLPKRIKKALTVGMPLVVTSLILYKLVNKYGPDLYKHFNITDYSVKVFGKEIPYLTKFNVYNQIIRETVGAIISLPALMYLTKFYRTQEKEADLTSINVTKNPTALISALDKIHKMNNRTKNIFSMIFNNIPNVLKTHPTKEYREEYLKNAVVA